MNYPSIKTIMNKLDLDNTQAKQVRGIMDESLDLEEFKSVRSLISQCYHSPNWLYMAMTALNEVLEGYGTEYIEEKKIEYVNMGDTYVTTVCYHNDRFKICCWGDFFE